MLAPIALLIGLALLMFAGDQFVLGSAHLAKIWRISPVVVGAVVLGFGTSTPELVVSALAAINDNPALGVGNVIGSNVANLSLGLGLAAVLSPVICSRSLLRKEAAMSVGSTAVFALFVLNGNLALWEGIVLAVLLVLAITILIKTAATVPEQEPPNLGADSPGASPATDTSPATDASQPTDTSQPTNQRKPGEVGRYVLRSILGLGGVLLGAQLAVSGATDLAERFGLTGGFVGFSIVAIGTSLPELATIAAAARKGHTELILGNLLGSNLFNSLAVGGAMGLVGAGDIMDESLTQVGIAVMVAVSLVAYLMACTKGRVGRNEGFVLLALYVGTIVLLAVLN